MEKVAVAVLPIADPGAWQEFVEEIRTDARACLPAPGRRTGGARLPPADTDGRPRGPRLGGRRPGPARHAPGGPDGEPRERPRALRAGPRRGEDSQDRPDRRGAAACPTSRQCDHVARPCAALEGRRLARATAPCSHRTLQPHASRYPVEGARTCSVPNGSAPWRPVRGADRPATRLRSRSRSSAHPLICYERALASRTHRSEAQLAGSAVRLAPGVG